MHASAPSAVHMHMVVIGLVVYGSVKVVCGSNIASVVPTRAIASLSMSPVDLLMSVLVVWLLMAVLVSVFSSRIWRIVLIVIFSVVMLVTRCVKDVGDCINAASMSDAMRRVRSNR